MDLTKRRASVNSCLWPSHLLTWARTDDAQLPQTRPFIIPVPLDDNTTTSALRGPRISSTTKFSQFSYVEVLRESARACTSCVFWLWLQVFVNQVVCYHATFLLHSGLHVVLLPFQLSFCRSTVYHSATQKDKQPFAVGHTHTHTQLRLIERCTLLHMNFFGQCEKCKVPWVDTAGMKLTTVPAVFSWFKKYFNRHSFLCFSNAFEQ